ncbi:response regulator [Oceanobacter mangrovi]|uniref:response regulator n=1 Tax=Oceanobacter mangrovi TaxID=2862510 RepID=UPI001C8D2ECE|nr:response regulator [Oceanobacter mangrovi]
MMFLQNMVEFLPMVLVIDDNPVNLDVVIEHLGQEAIDVRAATSGEEGLELARFLEPDLILLDVLMPGMNGYEVCRRLKRDPQLSKIPVIFLSALGEPVRRDHGLRVGAADYLQKPFVAAELKSSIWNHLAAA